MLNECPETIFKIVSPEQWQKSLKANYVVVGEIDTHFIHFSTQEQVTSVLNKFWKDRPHVILKIDAKKLSGKLVMESNPGGINKYPHLYNGSIPLEAILEVTN